MVITSHRLTTDPHGQIWRLPGPLVIQDWVLPRVTPGQPQPHQRYHPLPSEAERTPPCRFPNPGVEITPTPVKTCAVWVDADGLQRLDVRPRHLPRNRQLARVYRSIAAGRAEVERRARLAKQEKQERAKRASNIIYLDPPERSAKPLKLLTAGGA